MEKLEIAPQETMLNLIGGFWIARSIYLAAQLGIADVFDNQPKTIAQLAAATNTDPRSLYRLMRALASVGIFTEVSDQFFALTALGATLRGNSPNSMRYFALAQIGYAHSLGWSHGIHSLKTGEIAFDAAAGMSAWDYYAQNPEDAQIFSQSMTDLGREGLLNFRTGAVAILSHAQGLDTMRKQLINPPELYDGRPHGMSKAVIDTASATVYISGQVDWDTNHQVSCHTVEGQLKNVLTNLTIVLDAAGSSVENLLSLRVYVRGELGEFIGDIAPILAQYLGESRPAITGIGVSSLASKETLVEIEATAVLT